MTTNDITNSAPVVRKAVDGSVIPAVKAVQVHKAFGPLHVLKGIDLTVMPGTVTVILGPSGSGKSTFLRLINQLETLTGGSIEVDGELIGYKHVTKNGQDMLQTLDDKGDRRTAFSPRHGVPALQPVPAHDRTGKRDGSPDSRAAPVQESRP